MPQFTKGKWIVCENDKPDGSQREIFAMPYADGSVVCVAEVKQIHEDMFYRYSNEEIMRCITEKQANARLIAEAPKMYELLNKTFHILGKNTANDAICREIDECLSRVDGIPSEHKYTPTLTAASVDMYNLLKEVELWFHGENSAQVFILNDVKALLNSIDGKDEQ